MTDSSYLICFHLIIHSASQIFPTLTHSDALMLLLKNISEQVKALMLFNQHDLKGKSGGVVDDAMRCRATDGEKGKKGMRICVCVGI